MTCPLSYLGTFHIEMRKEWVEQERDSIARGRNSEVLGQDLLYCVSCEKEWSEHQSLHVHFIYSPARAHKARERLMMHVTHLRDEARSDPEHYMDHSRYTKYLEIRRHHNKASVRCSVVAKEQVIETALQHSGWMVLLSNTLTNAAESVRVYRDKDVVEKAFGRLKCSMDMKRLRVHSRQVMENKLFVAFLAISLQSAIHSVMDQHGLYKEQTMKQMLRTLGAYRVHTIAGQRIVQATTKRLKTIYKLGTIHPMSEP